MEQEDKPHQTSPKLGAHIGNVLTAVEELNPLERCHVLYAALGLTVWPLRRQGLDLGLPKEF
jgi:hypothetical protein